MRDNQQGADVQTDVEAWEAADRNVLGTQSRTNRACNNVRVARLRARLKERPCQYPVKTQWQRG